MNSTLDSQTSSKPSQTGDEDTSLWSAENTRCGENLRKIFEKIFDQVRRKDLFFFPPQDLSTPSRVPLRTGSGPPRRIRRLPFPEE